MGKVVNLFGMSQKIKPLRAESNSSPKVEKSNTSQAASIHEIVTLLKQRKPDTTQVLLALKSLLNIDSEFVESEPLVCSLLPELLDHRDAQVHTLAKETIVRFSELLAAQRPDAMAHWRTQIEELLSHDRRPLLITNHGGIPTNNRVIIWDVFHWQWLLVSKLTKPL